VQYSVRQFIDLAAAELGITLQWQGSGVDETARVAAIKSDLAPALKIGDVIVKVDPRYFRPAEVETLLGDPGKAHQQLGWKPKITLQEMVSEMVAHDLGQACQQVLLRNNGFSRSVATD
jgi:GDPmannose 4,6-dehydratase